MFGYSSELDAALNFAATRHAGQRRKGSDVPYLVHPVHVALILREYRYPLPVQIAGLLHDVVEDTDCTVAEIENEFGAWVAELVGYCTEPSKSMPWEQRKAALVEQLRSAPPEAKAVACADKIHNMATFVDALKAGRDDLWEHFSRDAADQLGYYKRVVDALATNFDGAIVSELRHTVVVFEEHVGS